DYSTGDIPHVLVASAVWEIPVGANRRTRVSGVLGAIVNDWTLSGILTLQSGVPIAMTQATNNNAFEFRAEAFNLTNTPFLGPPSGAFGAAAFVTIVSAVDPRVIQLAVKFIF